MNIIEHLEQTVSSLVLADTVDAAKLSLLEQFYAILATRLSSSQVQHDDKARSDSFDTIHHSLFEQLWQDPDDRQVIIKELSAAHHINEIVTTQLLINATPLAYQALKDSAKGDYLPAFLQHQQPILRQYLPAWSASVIAQRTHIEGSLTSAIITNSDKTTAGDAHILNTQNLEKEIIEQEELSDTDAIHANPSQHHADNYAYNYADNNEANNNEVKPFRVTSARNHNKGMRKTSWLLFALAVLAGMGLAWALVTKPKPVETIAAPPTVAAPVTPPVVVPLTPVSMSVGVDNSGNLYTCNAKVGDTSLQSTFMQALNVSFGEQASICDITVAKEIAASLPNMSIETLPDILTLLRATPFARLQLQNERIVLEAPDGLLLQQLVDDMRILVPAMPIERAAPIPLPDNLTTDNDVTTDNSITMNNPVDSGNETISNLNNNDVGNANNTTNNYQATDDETGDRVIPDTPNQYRNNNQNTNSTPVPSGPISLSELEEMASKEIRVDPVRAN
nr:hypothetical protein [uncultured Psychrobacter sp.]